MGKKFKHPSILEWLITLWDVDTMEILYFNRNDWTTVTQNSMDEFHKQNVEEKKPDKKKMLIYSIYKMLNTRLTSGDKSQINGYLLAGLVAEGMW